MGNRYRTRDREFNGKTGEKIWVDSRPKGAEIRVYNSDVADELSEKLNKEGLANKVRKQQTVLGQEFIIAVELKTELIKPHTPEFSALPRALQGNAKRAWYENKNDFLGKIDTVIGSLGFAETEQSRENRLNSSLATQL